MKLKPLLTATAFALAAIVSLTGCSTSEPAKDTSPSPTAVASQAFIADGLYQISFSEKSFATADGTETLPVSAEGFILFQDGKCAIDIMGADVMGTEIRIVKALDKNGHVWDSVSRSWTEMGSPYVPSLASANPNLVAFNRAGGDTYSFCSLAAFGEAFKVSATDPALYVASGADATAWVTANIAKYADGVATAAGLTGAAKDAAVAKIIAANAIPNLPDTRLYLYDVAGLVTIEDATEASQFKIDLIRQEDKNIAAFRPSIKAGEPLTAIADLAQGYIDSLK